MLFFWPFFLGDTPQKSSALIRLRSAMRPDDPAYSLVNELERALQRMHSRQQRLDNALRDLDQSGEANPRCRELLQQACKQTQQELNGVLAEIEETATRLILAREGGPGEEVSDLLGALHARMLSVLEV